MPCNGKSYKGFMSDTAAVIPVKGGFRLWEAVEDVLADPSEESLCVPRIYEFHHRAGSESFEFMDFFDSSMTRFTFRFMWCCYALAWATNMYDKSKESKDVDDRNPKP